MSGFTWGASRLTCGALCWLSACSTMANWTMVYPGSPPIGSTFDVSGEVYGAGEAPGADRIFSFQITEHGLGPVMALSNQMTEDESWEAEVGAPNEATWPVGAANAVLYDDVDRITYQTIYFED